MKNLFIFLFLFSSCVHPIKMYKEKGSNGASDVTEKTAHSFLWGLVSGPRIKTLKYCPTGWKSIEIFRSGGQMILSVLTVGIYTPLKVRFLCRKSEVAAGIEPT